MDRIFKHRGCKTPIVKYIGTQKMTGSMIIRSKDWVLMDGDSIGRFLICEDCSCKVSIGNKYLQEIENGQ